MRVDSKTVSAALLEGIQAISEKNGQIAELRSINAALQSQIDSLQQRVHLCAGYDKLVAENAALKERYRWVPVSERLPEPLKVVIAMNRSCGIKDLYVDSDHEWFNVPHWWREKGGVEFWCHGPAEPPEQPL